MLEQERVALAQLEQSGTTTTAASSLTKSVVIPSHVAARAASRFTPDPETGCHVSDYSVASHGYAQIGWHTAGGPRRGTTAHRASWVAASGTQIPDGMVVDHMCKNRRCVNVEHLRVLTNFDNARRTHGRDWPIGNGECINGHSAASYVHGVDTTHSNGFCLECFPELSWTIKERSSK